MANDKAGSSRRSENVRHPDPIMDAALDWFVTLQASPCDEMLQARLQAWLDSDPRHAEAFVELEELWELPELDIATERLATRLDTRTDAHTDIGNVSLITHARWQNRSAQRSKLGSRWAARLTAVAALFLIAISIQYYPVLMLRWNADFLTATGERREIALPDGSQMVLNTDSAVALDFEGATRSVQLLRGEAFFDVVTDPARPFKVAGLVGEVEVKGTAFSVRTGATDTVILERGRVGVSQRSPRAGPVMLAPGEMIEVTTAGLSPITAVDAERALAWRSGWIFFEEKPLADVLAELSRYYDGRIFTLDGEIGELRVSGNYQLADPENVIRSLAEAAGATVSRLPGGIIILR